MSYVLQDGRDVFAAGEPEIAVREETIERSVPRHVHTFCEVTLIQRGYAYFAHRQTVNVLLPGDVTIARPGVAHATPQCGALRVTVCAFTREAAETACAGVMALPRVRGLLMPGDALCLRPSEDAFDTLCALCARMTREQDARPDGWSEMLKAQLCEMLILLSRAGELPRRDADAALPITLVGRVIRFVEENYARPLLAEDIAGSVDMSADHLARQFRRVAGMTPMEYLRAYRMEKACDLLRGGASVQDAARAVGVEDQGAFSRQFKRMLGRSPMQLKSEAKL